MPDTCCGRDAGILNSFPTREEIIVIMVNVKWNCFVVPHVTHVLVCNYAALSQADTDQSEAGWVVSSQSDDRYIAVGNHTNLNKSEVCLYHFLSVFNIWIMDQRGFVVRRQIVACDRS